MRTRQSATRWLVIVLTAALLTVTVFSTTQSGVLASPSAAPAGGVISHSGKAAPFDTATPCTLPFVDVTGDPYLTAIQYIYCAGAISGIDDTHFGPTQPATRAVVLHALDVLFPTTTPTPTGTPSALGVTRAEIATLLVRRLNLSQTTPTGGIYFIDVPSNYWAYQFIETVAQDGIMGGYPDGTFRPNNNILRDELCQVLYNAVLYSLGTPPPSVTYVPPATSTPAPTDTPAATNTPAGPTPTDCPNVFVDITGNVFYTAIHTLNCRGVINGIDATHYGPAGTTTRGQLAKVIVLGFNIPLITPGGPGYFNCQPSYACIYLESAHAAGIIDGFTPQQCQDAGVPYPCALPNYPVTRAQLTKMVVVAKHWPLITPPGPPHFSDVPPTYWAYSYIETAVAHHLVGGYPNNLFYPNINHRRDEMAQFIYAGANLP